MENQSLAIALVVAAAVIGATLYFTRNTGASISKSSNDSNKKSGASKSDEKEKEKAAANKYPAGKMHIFFGSQTGTAEGFARTIMEEAKAKGFDAKMVDLEDFNPEDLAKSRLAIFLMATYGEGEPTDNASKFHAWLKNEEELIEPTFLNDLSFTVFGLGNRQYEHFNKMGKFTNAGLEKYGGKRVAEYGEGDDDGSLEEDFENWKEKLWPQLLPVFHPDYANGASVAPSAAVEKAKVELNFNLKMMDKSTAASIPVKTTNANNSTKHFFTCQRAKVLVNRELRNHALGKPVQEIGSTRHIEIDLTGTGISYLTADNLAVLPENDSASVERLALALGFDLDAYFTFEGTSSDFKAPFPTPCSVRDALTLYCDIRGHLRHGILSQLIPYIENASQREWLKSLLMKENRSQFKHMIEEKHVSLIDLVSDDLSSIRIPLADFFSIIPHLQPRYYTISSSSSIHPNNVHITVAITEYRLGHNGALFRGVCTSYLQNLTTKSTPPRIFVKASTFRLPKSPSTPIIMIGPGTGIAPMRALLQEREYQRAQQKANGRNTLFFGCKKSDEDYIYRDELERFTSNKVLDNLHLAFSRDQAQKVYVQHLMQQDAIAKEIVADIDSGAFIFVCGATMMGNDVHEALVQLIQSQKKVDKTQALKLVQELKDGHRYVQELWSA